MSRQVKKVNISGKEDKSNKVTSWSNTTTDAHYPSEKLVKDSLDGKANSTHNHNGIIDGGVNLCVGEPSSAGSDGLVFGVDSSTFHNKKVYFKDDSSDSSSTFHTLYWDILPEQFTYGDVFTFSFYAKGTGQINARFYGNSSSYIKNMRIASNSTVTGEDGVGTFGDGNTVFAINSSWKKYYVTWQLASSGDDPTRPKYVQFILYGGNTAYVSNVQLERGYNATDYNEQYLTSSDISGKIDTAGTGLSKSGTTLNHSNSVTALTTASLKKVKYDAQGHITGTSDVTSSDLPSHTHSYASTSHSHGNITSDGKIGGATGKIVVTTGNGVLDVADSITKSKISDFAHTHEYLSSSDLGLSSFTTEDFYEMTNWDVEPNIVRNDELIFNDDSIHNFTFNNLTYPFTITFDVIEAGGSIKRGSTELNSSKTPTQIIIVGNSSYSYTTTNVETGDSWNHSNLGLTIQNDTDDVVRIRNFKFTNNLLKPQIDNKIELSDLQSLVQTWESYSLNTYATLYVNHTLQQCELYYARSFSSGSANNLYNWGTGLIPSEYRPSHQVTGVIDQLGTCLVDADGNFKGRFTNAITSSTACKMTVQWHY